MLTFTDALIKRKGEKEKVFAAYTGILLFPGDYIDTDRGTYWVHQVTFAKEVEMWGVPDNDNDIIAGTLIGRNSAFILNNS